MDNKKIVALLRSGEVCSNIGSIEILNDTDIDIDGEVWKVLDDSEADEAFESFQKDLLRDLGLNSFSSWAKDYIMENCVDGEWFEYCMREYYENYVEELRRQGDLEDEMNEVDIEDEDEFIDHLCGQWHDGIEWYIENFGIEDCELMIEQKHLYNEDKIIEYVKDNDGRSCLSPYNGEEIELDDGYYAYRLE